MEKKHQNKNENTINKNKLRNTNNNDESPDINNQNRGYLNIFKSKEHLANQKNNKNDFKRKNSKPSDRRTRSQSESNMNQRNVNVNIGLEKKIENGFLEIKNIMNNNFNTMNNNFNKRFDDTNKKLDDTNKRLDNTNEILLETNKILSQIHDDLKYQNKSGINYHINEKEKNKSIIPSKINISMKDNISNDNNIFLHHKDNIKHTFPDDKKSTIDKKNFVNNPKGNMQISFKEIEGYNRTYKSKKEPKDSQSNNNKYIRNLNNIPNYIINKNVSGPLDTYKIKSKTQYFNINGPNNFNNYSSPGENLSKIEMKAQNFTSSSNKSFYDEMVNMMKKNNNSSKNSNGNNNANYSSNNDDNFSNKNSNFENNYFNNNYSRDYNQNINSNYLKEKKYK